MCGCVCVFLCVCVYVCVFEAFGDAKKRFLMTKPELMLKMLTVKQLFVFYDLCILLIWGQYS